MISKATQTSPSQEANRPQGVQAVAQLWFRG